MHPRSPALLLSVAALVAALGGTALAGGYVITSTRQIKPSVRKALQGDRGPRGFAGPDGARGPVGPTGVAGPAGAVGVAHIVIAQGATTLCAGTVQCSVGSAKAYCPAGTKPLGGGVATDALYGTFVGAIDAGNSYTVAADNYGSSSTADLTAYAYCSADVQSVQFPSGATMRTRGADLVARRLAAHDG